MKWVAAVITAVAGFVAMWTLAAIAWFFGAVPTILTLILAPALVGIAAGGLTSGRMALVAGLVGLVAGAVYLLAPFLEYIVIFGGLAVLSFAIGFAVGRRGLRRQRPMPRPSEADSTGQ